MRLGVTLRKIALAVLLARESCQYLTVGSLMAIKKVPATKPGKVMVQQRVKTTITQLVRNNVSALLRDRLAIDLINNELLRQYTAWLQGERTKSKFEFKGTLPINGKLVDTSRWTPERLAKAVDAQIGDIRRIFEPESGKGVPRLWIDEIIPVAVKLGVSPGFLLQPLREDLENNSLLVFPYFGEHEMSVLAQDWFVWVHGFEALPAQGQSEFARRMTVLSGTRNLPVGNVNQMEYDIELERISSAAIFSPISAYMEASEWPMGDLVSSSFQEHRRPNVHPFDLAVSEKTVVGRMQKRIKLVFIYMTHVRMALRLVQSAHRKNSVPSDIEWAINKLRNDLALLAVNQEFHQGASSHTPHQP